MEEGAIEIGLRSGRVSSGDETTTQTKEDLVTSCDPHSPIFENILT